MSAARLSVEYRGVVELRGPLLVVDEVSGVGWDEYATIRITSDSTASGVRHGLVLEINRDLAVVHGTSLSSPSDQLPSYRCPAQTVRPGCFPKPSLPWLAFRRRRPFPRAAP